MITLRESIDAPRTGTCCKGCGKRLGRGRHVTIWRSRGRWLCDSIVGHAHRKCVTKVRNVDVPLTVEVTS